MATKARGYAAVPGTGPAGETCSTCQHCTQHRMAGTWYKCGKMRHCWTGGVGTDIRTGAPACSQWEALKDGEFKPRRGKLNLEPWKLAPTDPPYCADPNQGALFSEGEEG